MDYVNIPILANFYVAKGFAVKVGIQPGFLVNDKVKVSSNGVSAGPASGVGKIRAYAIILPHNCSSFPFFCSIPSMV